MRPVGWGGVRHGNVFSRVTSSFHTLSAVCCGKLLVFIQYIISVWCRFYGSPVYTFWCLVLMIIMMMMIIMMKDDNDYENNL